MVIPFKLIVKKQCCLQVYQVYQLACASEKGINNNIKKESNLSSKNRCENDAQISGVKIMDHCAETDPKR